MYTITVNIPSGKPYTYACADMDELHFLINIFERSKEIINYTIFNEKYFDIEKQMWDAKKFIIPRNI